MLKIVMAMCKVVGDEDMLPVEDNETGTRVAQFLQMYLVRCLAHVVHFDVVCYATELETVVTWGTLFLTKGVDWQTQGDKNVIQQVRAYIAQDAEVAARMQALMAA